MISKNKGKAHYKFLLLLKDPLILAASLKNTVDSTKNDGTGETKLLISDFTLSVGPHKN